MPDASDGWVATFRLLKGGIPRALSRLGFMDSADASKLVFQWKPAKMRRKPGAA